MGEYFVHPTSIIDDDVEIGYGTKIWHFSHIQSGARIGKNCSFGQNVNVSNHVKVGDGCKIQNNVSLYEGVELEDFVFCGPSCVFTNDLTPRSRYPKGHAGYKRTLICHDATIGANATVVCGHEIGAYATIAAGAVVTKNVIPHALMAGVPARQIGWMCTCGQVLEAELVCPDCGKRYHLINGSLSEKKHGKQTWKEENGVQFRDLPKQYEVLKKQIDEVMIHVASSAHFISGPEVKELEKQLAEYVGVKHCITCANGTDALTIALRAWGIGHGEAVFVPDFTFFSSGECPADEDATPIFVDVDQRTYNLDPVKLEEAIKKVITEGKHKPKAVVAVDLFGLPANYDRIKPICDRYGLLLLEDGAQGFGGSINGKMACSFGDISTTSFFPAKPLGCYGDGGAIFTDNDEWADLIRSICVHGKDTSNPNDPNAKYNNIRLGMNSRLDTLQAAILLPKFKAFVDYELKDINQVARWYTEGLKDTALVLPEIKDGFYSSWAQYTIQLPDGTDRKALQEKLKAAGIPSMVYYAKPMHLQGAFAGTDSANADCPVTEQLCSTVLSLPLDPYKKKIEIEMIITELKKSLGE